MTKLEPVQMKQRLRWQKPPSQALRETNKQESHTGFVLKSNITEVMKEIPNLISKLQSHEESAFSGNP